MMSIDWKSPKKLALPLNILLFNLCRLWPFRNKRIWVFGAREGHQYEDNSRALFEYVLQNKDAQIRSIWLTRNAEVADMLKGRGCEAYKTRSLKGMWAALRAGASFYTNGLIDFGLFPLVGGSKVVALWHGMGFKRIYNGNYSGKSLRAKKILDCFFSWTYRNITISTSAYASKWLAEMFTLNKDKIFVTGQPRNDMLKELSKAAVLKGTGIDCGKKLILYMPTYRQSALGFDAMQRIVEGLYHSESLNRVLKEMNAVFVVKPHPLTPHIQLKNRDNFIVIDYGAVENNQELMGVSDVLVTDYSSCFIDYALLERPIVFYVPDEELFLKKSEKLDDTFFDLEQLSKAVDEDGLAELIRHSSCEVAKRTNELFEDKSIQGTCYSENVFNVIVKETNIF